MPRSHPKKLPVVLFVVLLTAKCGYAQLSLLPGELRLVGSEDSRQIVVTQATKQYPIDVTRQVRYEVYPKGIVGVSSRGYVTPVANGRANIIATKSDGQTVSIAVEVEAFHDERRVSFPNDVVPQLTRAGCNSGACHGTPKGKNNFRLSLLGFEPKTDFEFLTRESRGRRVFPAAPERSLLLQKASGGVPHGGGIRIKKGDTAYNVVKR